MTTDGSDVNINYVDFSAVLKKKTEVVKLIGPNYTQRYDRQAHIPYISNTVNTCE